MLNSSAKMPNNYRIATIPGDGIGPEVIAAGITALQALSDTLGTFTLDFTHIDWNSGTYKKTGRYIPENGLSELKKHDAILFGAVGAPGKPYPTPSGTTQSKVGTNPLIQ